MVKMNVVIGQSRKVSRVLSTARYQSYPILACAQNRSFVNQNRNRQQLESHLSNPINDAPPPHFSKLQSKEETDLKESINAEMVQKDFPSEKKFIRAHSNCLTARRLKGKARRQERLLRKTRIKLARFNERSYELAQIRSQSSTNSQKQNLEGGTAIRLQTEPTSNEKSEWKKAMMKFSSMFRQDDEYDNSIPRKDSNDDTHSRKIGNEKESLAFDASQMSQYDERHPFRRDYKSRSIRAVINAQSMESARQSQQETSSTEKSIIEHTIAPGAGTGLYPFYLAFEETSMIYPPRDRYPPALPLVRKHDLQMTAIAFGLSRACDVQWVEGKGNDVSDGIKEGGAWRRVIFGEDFVTRHFDSDRLDTGQGLEYIGDSVLHLISRSCIMSRFPRRSMMIYNIGANWIVSNDVFGHIFIDSGLMEERKIVVEILVQRNKEFQLEQMKPFISKEQFEIRKNAPLPAKQLPALAHLRGADLFEAYVGAIYLTMGFNKASEWCTALFEPWLDRIGRTEHFLTRDTLTIAGEARARMEEQIREQIMKEIREGKQNKDNQSWLRSIDQFFRGKD